MVNVIDLTDRRPLEFEGHYLWHPGPNELAWDYLPRDIFDRLTGHINKPAHVTQRVKVYTSEAEAMTALRVAVGGVSVTHDRMPAEQEVKGGDHAG